MKKIVSIIFTLFVLALNVNAQTAKFVYKPAFKSISLFGESNKTFTSTDGIISVNFKYKDGFAGINKSNPNMVLINSATSSNEFIVTVSLNDVNEEGLSLKKVVFSCGDPNLLITSTLNNSEVVSQSVSGSNYVLSVNSSSVDEVAFENVVSEWISISSITVEYGKINPQIELTDGVDYPYWGETICAGEVVYKRNMNGNNWGTLCLPFKYTIDDDNFMAYTMCWRDVSNGNNSVSLTKYSNGTVIPSGAPIIFYTKKSQLVVSATDVTLSTDNFNDDRIVELSKTTMNNYDFVIKGTLKRTSFTNGFYVAKNSLYETTGKEIGMKAYRAWIEPVGEGAEALIRNMSFTDDIEDETTGLSFTSADEQTSEKYTINGTRVNELQKGLNIIKTANGVKKVYIK